MYPANITYGPVQQRWRATDRCTPIDRDERGKPLQTPPSPWHGHCKPFPDERSPVATRGTVHYMQVRSPSARPDLMRNGPHPSAVNNHLHPCFPNPATSSAATSPTRRTSCAIKTAPTTHTAKASWLNLPLIREPARPNADTKDYRINCTVRVHNGTPSWLPRSI